MIRNVLVGLDGSPVSEQSLPWVARLAPGARITLLRAYVPLYTANDPWMGDAAFTAESNAQAERSILNHLTRIASRVEPKPRTLVRPGSGAMALLDAIRDRRFDLVAITTRGGQSLKRRIVGGTTEHLIHHSHVPLLVVPVSPKNSASARKVRSIAVPWDGSSSSELVLPLATEIARSCRAEILLVHVLRDLDRLRWESGIWAGGVPESAASDRFKAAIGQLEVSLRERLEAVERDLGKKGIRTKSAVVRGEVPESLARACAAHSCDLIAMCVRGHGAIQHLLEGSTVSRILQGTRIPVVLIRDDSSKSRPGPSKRR